MLSNSLSVKAKAVKPTSKTQILHRFAASFSQILNSSHSSKPKYVSEKTNRQQTQIPSFLPWTLPPDFAFAFAFAFWLWRWLEKEASRVGVCVGV
jgi:hypothetical protein